MRVASRLVDFSARCKVREAYCPASAFTEIPIGAMISQAMMHDEIAWIRFDGDLHPAVLVVEVQQSEGEAKDRALAMWLNTSLVRL